MTKYKNLEFYFYVLLLFLAFFFSRPVNVFAEEEKTVNIHVINTSDVFDYEKFYVSNFSRVQDGTVNGAVPYFDNRQMLLSSACGTNGREPCYLFNFTDSDVYTSDTVQANQLLDLVDSGDYNLPDFYEKGYKEVVQTKFWTHVDYSHLQFNKTYQIAFKIQKDNNLHFGSFTSDSNALHIEITDEDNPVNTINVDSIVDKSLHLFVVDNNHAFVVINFKFDNSKYVYNFTNFSLNNVNIDMIEDEQPNENMSFPYFEASKKIWVYENGNSFSGLLYNSSYEHQYYWKVTAFYFLEDGFLSFDNEHLLLDGTTSDEIDTDLYETLDESDLGIYDADYYCRVNDLMCHINNIIRNIKNVFQKIGRVIQSVIDKIQEVITSIFTSIVNALKSLFLPSDDFISDFFDDQYDYLQTKLGILLAPFTIIGQVLNRFISLTPNHSISYNGFTFPIWNVRLIPAFNFDFVEFYSQKPEIASLYSYYQMGITAILYILFLMLCYKKFKNLIGGDSN